MEKKASVTKVLDRKLGLLSVVAISVGAMLGSGIFVLPGIAASMAGPMVALSYVLAGFLVLPALLAKAELATAMPVSGGSFVYIDRAMGPWMGTIAGLGTWLALSAKTAFALVGLGAYMAIFGHFSATEQAMISAGILGLLLTLNALGASKAMLVQIVIVAICLAALAWFGFEGGMAAKVELFEPAFPLGWEGILVGASFVFVSYNGVTKVCSVAEEIKNPSRNIPLGMIGAQLGVMVLYAAIALVVVGNIPWDTMSDERTPVASAALVFLGESGMKVMAVVAIMGLVSMCNAGILATSRFPFAMSRGDLMPAVLGKVSKRFGTPIVAIVFTGALLLVLLLGLNVTKLAKLASGFTIFIFMVENLALIVLRESHPGWYKPTFRVPFYPVLPLLGIFGGIFLIVSLGGIALVSISGAVLFGTAWFFIYGKKRVERGSSLRHLIWQRRVLRETINDEEEAPDTRPQVVVPIWGDEPTPERLMQLASSFIIDDRMLEVLRLEEVPDQAALAEFVETDALAESLAAHAKTIGEKMHVDVEFRSVLTHNAQQTLHDHAVENDTHWIVMQWPKPKLLPSLVKNPQMWWLQNAPCNVGVFLDRAPLGEGNAFRQITVLLDGDADAARLVRVADRLAQQSGCTMSLLSVLDAESTEMAERKALHEKLVASVSAPVASKVITADDRIAAVKRETEKTGLLILEADNAPFWRMLFTDSFQKRAGLSVGCSVLKIQPLS